MIIYPQGRQGSRAQGAPAQQVGDLARQLANVEARRDALNDQLTSLTVRRDLLTQQMRNADDAGKAQLQAQVREVGRRTEQVMAQLNALDDTQNRLLANTDIAVPTPQPAQGPQGIQRPQIAPGPFISVQPSGPSNNVLARMVRQSMAFQGVTFVLLFVFMWRFTRRSRPAKVALGAEDVTRLEQMQRAVDVMSVEVERISESQRYIAKLLSEGRALGTGAAQEVPVRERDASPARIDRG